MNCVNKFGQSASFMQVERHAEKHLAGSCIHVKTLTPTPLPLLSSSLLPWYLMSWVDEDVQKNGFKLLEDNSGHSKVPLQLVDLVPEGFGQAGHV